MSLATRCTSCGTIFRVVQDQLKVSEGWVRCGQCDEVFNALHGLFDLEHESPPEWPGVPRTAGGETSTVVAASASVTPHDLPDRASAHPSDAETPHIHVASHPEAPAAPFDILAQPGPVDAVRATEFSANVLDELGEEESRRSVTSAAVPVSEPPEVGGPTPDFVHQTRRQARWQSRPVVAALWAAALVLAMLLTMQVLHHFRDLAVSRWPNLKPGLTSLCAALDCMIAAPRRIDRVAIENSALTRGSAPDSLRLSLTLRNRSPYPVAIPSIDLSLTNMAGQLIARRALSPRDFRVTTSRLEPGIELPLNSLLSTGNSLVAGYTVEVFYP